MTTQIFFGSSLLMACALAHVAVIALSVPLFTRVGNRTKGLPAPIFVAAILGFGIGVVLAAHTVQIWSWAIVLDLLGAFDKFSDSFYFATVTYTTLGYGDVVLGSDLRIFATFASITGLLAFGVSTAFLISILTGLASLPTPPRD